MQHFNLTDIENLDRFYRGNLINSATGFKPANLIISKDSESKLNAAIFSSVVHLGSDPAMFTFIQRPLGYGAGDTFNNLTATKTGTLNHVPHHLWDKIHQSSAKFEAQVNELMELGLPVSFINDEEIPVLTDAPVAMKFELLRSERFPENNCILCICKILDLYVERDLLHEDGFIDLRNSSIINGLDGYGKAQVDKRYSYAKPDSSTHVIWSRDE